MAPRSSTPPLARHSSAVSVRAAYAFGDWPPASTVLVEPKLEPVDPAIAARQMAGYAELASRVSRPFHKVCGIATDLHRGGRCPNELEARAADGDR